MIPKLTEKQKDILMFLSLHPLSGNDAMAKGLYISKNTLRVHMKNLYERLGITGNQFEKRMIIIMKATDLYIKGALGRKDK